MAYGVFILKVEEYAKWKTDWDRSIDLRKAGGQKSYQIFQTVDDPHNVVLYIEWDSLDNMRNFMQSAELREALRRSGVSRTESYFLEQVEKGAT
jgi:heme-degrading monooxygenase HmoA